MLKWYNKRDALKLSTCHDDEIEEEETLCRNRKIIIDCNPEKHMQHHLQSIPSKRALEYT